MEPLLHLILALAILGFQVWLVVTYVPMPQVFKSVIIGLAVIGLLWWFISTYGGKL